MKVMELLNNQKKRCSDEPIDGNKPNKVRWQWNHQIGKKSVMVTSLNPKP
jgi:hypothetical protein